MQRQFMLLCICPVALEAVDRQFSDCSDQCGLHGRLRLTVARRSGAFSRQVEDNSAVVEVLG